MGGQTDVWTGGWVRVAGKLGGRQTGSCEWQVDLVNPGHSAVPQNTKHTAYTVETRGQCDWRLFIINQNKENHGSPVQAL